MNWLLKLLFPQLRETIRMNPSHLPGLKAPKAAPFVPKHLKPEQPNEPDIRAFYQRFQAAERLAPTKKSKKKNGLGL